MKRCFFCIKNNLLLIKIEKNMKYLKISGCLNCPYSEQKPAYYDSSCNEMIVLCEHENYIPLPEAEAKQYPNEVYRTEWRSNNLPFNCPLPNSIDSCPSCGFDLDPEEGNEDVSV